MEKRGIVSSISIETLRGILNEAEITYQHTKTWKESNDPEYEVKKNESNKLYRHPPKDGRVICLDEFGPLNLQPHRGQGGYPVKEPVSWPATYTRPHGVRHLLCAYT